MKKFLPLITCAIILVSCQKENEKISQIPFLREKFQGNYGIISSYSKIPVDLNNDGVESTNLLTENSLILFDAELLFRIPSGFDDDNVFILDEIWPTENEERPRITKVLPIYEIRTDGSGVGYCPLINRIDGTFADDFQSASFKILYPDKESNTLIDINYEFLEDETIKAIATRKLYTSNGWITTEIESVYKRNLILR
jgi:hypothetical protein